MKSNRQFIHDPFFIVYDSRSGSTFLANLLIKYAKIAIPPESNFIRRIFFQYSKNSVDYKKDLENIIDVIYGERKFSDWGIKRTTIKKTAEDLLPMSIRRFISLVCTIYKDKNFPNSEIFGIKKGGYMRHHKKLKTIFPKSKFITIIRDGRAIFNSKKHSIRSETGKPFETNPFRAAKVWCEKLRFFKEIKTNYEKDTLIISYEKMVSDTDQKLRLVCDFLNITYNSSYTSHDKKYLVSNRYGNLHKNVEKNALTYRISAWQESLSAAEIFAFESIAYNQLLSMGYELVNQVKSLKNPLNKIKTKLRLIRAKI